MTFSLPFWVIPLALTGMIWTTATLWSKGPRGGDYNFGPALLGAFHGLLAIIATLLVWLVFFIFV